MNFNCSSSPFSLLTDHHQLQISILFTARLLQWSDLNESRRQLIFHSISQTPSNSMLMSEPSENVKNFAIWVTAKQRERRKWRLNDSVEKFIALK